MTNVLFLIVVSHLLCVIYSSYIGVKWGILFSQWCNLAVAMVVAGQCYRNVLPHLFSIYFLVMWLQHSVISVGQSVHNLIQTEISQQIFDDLTWNSLQTFVVVTNKPYWLWWSLALNLSCWTDCHCVLVQSGYHGMNLSYTCSPQLQNSRLLLLLFSESACRC